MGGNNSKLAAPITPTHTGPKPTTAPTPLGYVLPLEIKTVSLPDGSAVQRTMNQFILRSASGATMSLSPPPLYIPSNKLTGKQEMIIKSSGARKMSYKNAKKWSEGELKMDGPSVSWNGEGACTMKLVVGTIIAQVDANTPKKKDANEMKMGMGSLMAMTTQPIGNMMSNTEGEVGQNFCVEITPPLDVSKALNSVDALQAMSPLQLAASGGPSIEKQVTYYFQFSTAEERNEWYYSLLHNANAYLGTEDCFNQTKSTFVNLASRLGINTSTPNWREVLDALYDA